MAAVRSSSSRLLEPSLNGHDLQAVDSVRHVADRTFANERERAGALPHSRSLLRGLRLNRRPPCEEVIERRVRLLVRENPRRSLCFERTWERHSKVTANELPADAENVCDFLRTSVRARTK